MDTKSLSMDDFTVEDNIKGTPLIPLYPGMSTLAHSTYQIGYTIDYRTPPVVPQDIVQDQDTGILYAEANGKYYTITQQHDGALGFKSAPSLEQKPDPAKLSSMLGKTYSFNAFVDFTPSGGKTLETDGNGNFYVDDGQGHMTKSALSLKIVGSSLMSTFTDTGVAVANSHTLTPNPLKTIDAALAQVDKLRSGLGAVQNRFDSVISNLNNTVNNLSESRSRILDADFASEVSEMSRANILQSAGTSVLAQANQVPQNVLQLLR